PGRCTQADENAQNADQGVVRAPSGSALGMPRRNRCPRLFLLLVDDPQQSAQHVGDARPGDGRNDERRLPRSAFEPRAMLFSLWRRQRIRLVQRHDFGFFPKPFAIGLKFRADGLVDFSRVLGGAVDKMQEHAAALDMPEESVAQPGPLMRALDEAGYICEDE